MFEQVPAKGPYADDTSAYRQIRDFEHMLQVLNHLIITAPLWDEQSERLSMIAVRMKAVLDWPMGTRSGFAFFLDPAVNRMLKRVLDAWGDFLRSEESARQALGEDDNGWFNPKAKAAITTATNQATGTAHDFAEIFECDPSKPHYGFRSWDAFFTRTFREGIRPVAAPEDDAVIANACESKPYKVAYDCALRDKFWIKGEPYSLVDMLAHDALARRFAGGTVYQGFLSALSYHRWHAPVAGRCVKAYVQPGAYYSEPLVDVGDREARGGGGPEDKPTSQAYVTAVATRAIIFIEADNPAIGLMAFLGVGLAEVSSCEITVQEGQRVQKGGQLGMFHFGGSTHCVVFRRETDVRGFPGPGTETIVPVRGQLAVVEGRRT
ncbi:hypothetical protein EVJ58_g5105 [Rhodofomes roseus]|uniref:L-tryptophan decarboxylase PsiD-like domain-containing protein n=1 Tax=Rhodofomes roseus TaxID=34475 RepID=A0A4Y9YDV3_9APHY|nr:hypothetical protein EVJ58_g5105 [Rhodofomes roseus]